MGWAIPAAILASSILPQLFGKKSSTWSGEKSKIHKLPTMSSQQQKMFKDLFKHPDNYLTPIQNQPLYGEGSEYLHKIISQDPEMMKQFEAPMMRQFNEQIVPNVAERFSGVGARGSSGFNQAMAHEAGSLSERIAAMRANLGLGAAGQALGYAQVPYNQQLAKLQFMLGTPTFGYQATGGTPGAGSGFSTGLANAGAYGLGMYAAGGGGGGGGAPVRSGTWGTGFPGMS